MISLYFAATLIGLSKTGIQGIGTLAVPILALAYGSKPSTGILLPILCMADLIAVIYYRRSAEWKYILKLLPTTILGFFLALAVDSLIPTNYFRYLLSFTILVGIAVLFWTETKDKENLLPDKWWYAHLFGLLGGFTTMIGNAAGPVMAVYLLSMKLPKYSYVGTGAWFFMIVNLLKLPLQIFAWNNITAETLLLDLQTIPFIVVGAFLGIKLVNALPERIFRRVIIYLTVFSALMLLF